MRTQLTAPCGCVEKERKIDSYSKPYFSDQPCLAIIPVFIVGIIAYLRTR